MNPTLSNVIRFDPWKQCRPMKNDDESDVLNGREAVKPATGWPPICRSSVPVFTLPVISMSLVQTPTLRFREDLFPELSAP